MKRVRLYLAVFSIVLATGWILPGGLYAQDVNRAAVVVRHSDERVQTACVEFPETEITVLELTQRSHPDLEIDLQSLGAIICRIDQTGCSSDDCWCQCRGGGECIYWSFWHQIEDEWQYSQMGASQRTVHDGDVEGWSWGPGAIDTAVPPPKLTFEEICANPQNRAAGSETAASVDSVNSLIVPRPGEQNTKKQKESSAELQLNITAVAAAVQAPDLQATQAASENQIAGTKAESRRDSLSSYAFFGLLILGLVGLLLFSPVRRRGRQR